MAFKAEAVIVAVSMILLIFKGGLAAPATGTGHDHSVAFSAGLTNTQHISDTDTIRYDKTFVNIHNAYNPNTGVFTCPVPGIYMFHFHAYDTNKDTVMWLDLLHNDQPVVSVSGYNSHTVGSNTVMLKLRKNDRVQVQSKELQQFSLFGLQDQIYSTFTGYLVIPQDQVFMDSANPPLIG